jgi:acetylornithine deacetylase/succinyl-diaminopimelate desuccinylase-like protein
MIKKRTLILTYLVLFTFPVLAENNYFEVGKETLADLIQIKSTESVGLATRASEYASEQLRSAGFDQDDLKIVGPTSTTQGLVATLKGIESDRPVIVMAHLDVVPAVTESWDTNPYRMVEKDGFFYGRGTSDNKGGAAALITTFIRLKTEGFVPDNDIIMLLTGDEETQMDGIAYFKNNLEQVKRAAFAFNTDAGYVSGTMDTPKSFQVQTAEKIYMTLKLEARNTGGHSSVPRRENAIYDLMHALERLERHQFPISLNQTSRKNLEFTASEYPETLSEIINKILADASDVGDIDLIDQDPELNAQLRTTCVATQLFGGHAENALPVNVSATVNCRVLPHEDPDKILATIQRISGTKVAVSVTYPAIKSPPSMLTKQVEKLIKTAVDKTFQNIPVVPMMETGATDAIYLRSAGIPVYGTSSIMEDPTGGRAHGLNERVEVDAFAASLEFWYQLMKQL